MKSGSERKLSASFSVIGGSVVAAAIESQAYHEGEMAAASAKNVGRRNNRRRETLRRQHQRKRGESGWLAQKMKSYLLHRQAENKQHRSLKKINQ